MWSSYQVFVSTSAFAYTALHSQGSLFLLPYLIKSINCVKATGFLEQINHRKNHNPERIETLSLRNQYSVSTWLRHEEPVTVDLFLMRFAVSVAIVLKVFMAFL